MKHYWRTNFRLVLKSGEIVSVSDEGEYFYISGRGGGVCTSYADSYGAASRFADGENFHITSGYGDGNTIIRTISHSSIRYIECIPSSQLVYDTGSNEWPPKMDSEPVAFKIPSSVKKAEKKLERTIDLEKSK